MGDLTPLEAFEAMRSFIAQFAAREPAESQERLRLLLLWTENVGKGDTSDPAQWNDWLRSVEDARSRLSDGQRLVIP